MTDLCPFKFWLCFYASCFEQDLFRCRCTFMETGHCVLCYESACKALAWLQGQSAAMLWTFRLFVDNFHWLQQTLCDWNLCESSSTLCSGANTEVRDRSSSLWLYIECCCPLSPTLFVYAFRVGFSCALFGGLCSGLSAG